MPNTSSKKRPVPSEAILQLLAPDGYYTYLGIEKTKNVRLTSGDADASDNSSSNNNNGNSSTSATSIVDEELIKKSYRKLSLRHHPDRPTGDADTFRVLNRAQKVLLNPKLRQQYDLIGLDLDDDEEETDGNNATSSGRASSSDSSEEPEEGNSSSGSSTMESIMSQIASATLATIFQIIVRTVMMGLVSVVLVRFQITLYPALAFLVFIAYRLYSVAPPSSGSVGDTASPLLIGLGLILMHRGRTYENPWSWSFWVGEMLVVIMFTYNSVPHNHSPYVALGVASLAFVLTLWLRGNPWKYGTLVALEAIIAILAALAFPVMEMILEQILNDKLRRVGEKVRAHSERLEAYYSEYIQNDKM